jgi:acyl dehydratase
MGGYFAYHPYLCQKDDWSCAGNEMPLSSEVVGHTTRRFRHEVDARWLMAYAASLGDQLPCYFDTTERLTAHPVFPVCLEWPVVLDARHVEGYATMTSEERARGVHATHDLFIHRPLRADTAYITESTIVGVEQRPSGAFQLTRLDTRDTEGELCITTHQGSLSRDVRVEGGDRWLERPPVLPEPDTSEPVNDVYTVAVDAGLAHCYTECARIWNPIHTDRAVALAAGLPDIILHGTATLALAVSAVVNNLLDGHPERVKRVACRFSGMVLMPTTLSVRVAQRSDTGCWFNVECDGKDVIKGGFLGF